MSVSMTYPQLLRRECTIHGSVVHMSPIMANVFELMILRRGHLVPWIDIIAAAYPDVDNEPDWSLESIKVILTRHRALRKVIETQWGQGLFLPR